MGLFLIIVETIVGRISFFKGFFFRILKNVLKETTQINK